MICSSAASYLKQFQVLLHSIDVPAIDALSDLMYDAWGDDRLVVVFGNGGSASSAGHWATDLVKTAAVDGCRRLRSISLVDNAGLTTAIGNDISYEETFSYALESYARTDDVAVGISASGNSPNMVRAFQHGMDRGLRLVAVTGFAGGSIGKMCDLHINIPSDNYGLIEDMQLAVGHMVAQGLKSRLMQGVPAA